MLPLALGEDIDGAVTASSGLERSGNRQLTLVIGHVQILSLRASRLLLLRRRLLLAGETRC